jgi:transcription antitermination factor NusG
MEFIAVCSCVLVLVRQRFLNALQNERKWRWDSIGGSYGEETQSLIAPTESPQGAPSDGLQSWFAIETRYRYEKKIAAQLQRKGLEVFLPLLTESHTWSDRQKAVTTPLFPGYAFVRLHSSGLSQMVLQTAGLIRFVTFGGILAAVPAKQIEDLQLLLQKKGPFSLHAFVHTGQRVRIRGGSLHGLEGILLEQGKQKLVISVQSIQRSLVIEIQGYELELV